MPRNFWDEVGADFDDSMGADFDESMGAEFGAAGPGFEDIMVGIPPTVFAGAGQQVINIQVTQPFRADRLILDAAARTCTIEQISISSVDQNRGDGDLPGDMFTPDATHRLAGNIVDPGVGISMRVTAPGALTFRGGLFGPARPGSSVAKSRGKFDRVACGIPLTTVGAGLSAQIIMNPTQFFRAEKLVLNAAARVAGVTVDQISISSEDQNRASGISAVPAELFTPDSTHRLRGTIVKPGVGVRMTVTNNTAGAINVGGAFFGPALRG